MTTESNALFVRNAIEVAWNTSGNFHAWRDFVTSGYVHHVFNGVTDIEGWLAGAGGLTAAFSEIKYEIRSVLADGEQVSVHFTQTAKQTGALGPQPATGKLLRTTGAFFCRMEEGKIAEDWEVWMALPVVRQLIAQAAT
ncbi:MAG: ester cyclase [bacterium]